MKRQYGIQQTTIVLLVGEDTQHKKASTEDHWGKTAGPKCETAVWLLFKMPKQLSQHSAVVQL